MTPKEAKQLKPGDRVLVEAEVSCPVIGYPRTHHISSRGNVGLKMAILGTPCVTHCMVAPETIREKVSSMPRKFKNGDFVWYKNAFFRVLNDSDGESVHIVKSGGEGDNPMNERIVVSADDVQLVSAVEDLADRKEEA